MTGVTRVSTRDPHLYTIWPDADASDHFPPLEMRVTWLVDDLNFLAYKRGCTFHTHQVACVIARTPGVLTHPNVFQYRSSLLRNYL